MRVLIDARMLIGRFSGVARVVTGLAEELTRDRNVKIVALCGARPHRMWDGRRDIEIITTGFHGGMRTPIRRVLWEEAKLPRLIARSRADLYHATWNHGIPLGCPIPAVLTIHDLIPWSAPAGRLTVRASRAVYRYAVRASARRAAVITTVSDYTRRLVIETVGCPAARVVTVHNGVCAAPSKLGGRPSSLQPFVLYVGGHEPRKNVAAVLAVMREFWERFGPRVELRLTGTVGGLCPHAARTYNTLPAHAPIQFLGQPDDDELASQYATARALLFLSTDEGFGLPVIEAMAQGCPVVAANRAALPEVVGDAGLLVDPGDTAAVVAALRRVLLDSPARTELIDRGIQRGANFTRAALAERMLEVYRRALRKGAEREHSAAESAGVAPSAPRSSPRVDW